MIKSYDTLSELSSEDILDSRDLEELIGTLEELIGTLEELIGTLEEEQSAHIEDEHDGSWDATDGAELLDALRELRSETEDEGWAHGITFIRDSYFEDYAREMAEDAGLLGDAYTWPLNYIDWEQAARELQMDYMSIKIGGTTFWYREA